MTHPFRLSMVMIARNERHNVRACFESFWDYVDEVVLCDTGSRDGTVGEARRFARERGEPAKLIVGRMRWCDHFGKARTYAHSLAAGGVHGTIDLDDRLVGGEHLRDAAQMLIEQPELGSIWAIWTGGCGESLTVDEWRARLWRAPVTWVNPTWEEVEVDGGAQLNHQLVWRHERKVVRGPRDRVIALRWAAAEPDNFRPLRAAAWESFGMEDYPAVVDLCARCLSLPDLDPIVRGTMLGLQAQAVFDQLALDNFPDGCREVVELAAAAVKLAPAMSRAWMLLANCALLNCLWENALRHAQRAYAFARTNHEWMTGLGACLQALVALEREGRVPAGFALAEVRKLKREGRLPDGLRVPFRQAEWLGRSSSAAA